MLDTNARKYVQPAIQKVADVCIKLKISANQVTVFAFGLGMSAGLLIYLGHPLIGVSLLWISGLLDAVDGSIARATKSSGAWGALMDLIFDRFVEMGLIVALALNHPEAQMIFIFLLCAILFSMCVFLSVGALSANNSNKAFKYQAGVMERTEGFVCFTLMALFQGYISYIAIGTAVLIFFTALQRMNEARKLFEKK